MSEVDIGALLRAAMMVMLKLGGPPLLATLAAGLLISLVQAVTQVNEPTLVFVPKVLALCAALAVAGPFMLGTLHDFSLYLFARLVAVGGS
jgi:flagellar biosynthetic protein FliQ